MAPTRRNQTTAKAGHPKRGEIYLAALSRTPTPLEASHCLNLLKNAQGEDARILVYQDLLWAILNSKEFAHVF